MDYKDEMITNEEFKPLEKKKRQVSEDDHVISDDVDTGWAWFVLVACFGNFCLFGCAQWFAGGIIYSILLEKYNSGAYLTSWAGSLHASLISLAGPLSSAISDRYSCRIAVVTGGFLYVAGYLLTALAPNIYAAIITCGLISGIGGGMAYSANMVVVSYNFRKRRTLALGIALAGAGVGVFILAPLLQFLREYYGSFGFFLMMAGLFSHMILFGVMYFPNSVERRTIRQSSRVMDTTIGKGSTCRSFFNKYWSVLSNKGIFCLALSNLFYCISLYVLFLYFLTFIVHKEFTAREASFFVSIAGITNIFGRIVCGIVGSMQWINNIVVFSSTIGVVGLSSIVYPFIASYYAGHVGYFIILGLFMGQCYVLTPSVTLNFVGVESLATAIGVEFAFAGIGATIGPVFAGLFLDLGGSYEQAIIFAGVSSLIAAAVSGITVCFKQLPDVPTTEMCKDEMVAMVSVKDKKVIDVT